MIIEYVAEGGDATPAILIYGRDWEACQSLEQSFQNLSQGKVKQVAIHLIPKFDAKDGVKLTARVADTDAGVIAGDGPNNFDISLSKASWARIAQALQPFCRPLPEEQDTAQQLDRSGKIALTIATDKL